MSKKRIGTGVILLLIGSIFLSVCYLKNGYASIEGTALNENIKQVTSAYGIRQVIASLLLFLYGYLCVHPFCDKLGPAWNIVLAMPVGNALWGGLSTIVLCLNIPYNRFSMLALLLFILLLFIVIYRKSYLNIDIISLTEAAGVVLALTILATVGYFAIYNSSDSYYFVMQYGELIAARGKLSSDIAGTYMTWTGITPALMSSYAKIWGFENIYAIHYLLLSSMYGCILLSVLHYALKRYTKKQSVLLAVFTILTIMIIPAVAYMSMWIIANTYFMMYIVFVVLIPLVHREQMEGKLLALISLFNVWLTLSRPEGALVMCFFVIGISSLRLSRKSVFVLYFPQCVAQFLYFGKLLYEYLIGAEQAANAMLTKETIAILLLSLFLTALYLVIYNTKLVVFIRTHMTVLVLSALLVAILLLGVLDIEKFVTNITVTAQNFTGWWWKYVPITVLIIEVLKICFKCRNRYFDLMVLGFVLCTFAVCMGRPHPLRLGYGDSFNRMCMSIVPLYVASTVCTFLMKVEEENVDGWSTEEYDKR